MMTFNDYPTDSEQLMAFVSRSENKLLQQAYQRLNDWHLAQDAVQASILQLIKYYDLVRDFEQPRLLRYSLRIVSNVCYRILKAKSREVSFDEMESLNDIDPNNEIEGFYERIDQQLLRQCLDKLSYTYRIALCMKYFESADDAEIASVLNIMPNSVRMVLTRARSKLIALYKEAGGDNE